MIVYAESNFVLELALLQEQHGACEELIHLAERGRIRLVLPAFAITEPYSTIFRRGAERGAVRQKLQSSLRELARTTTLTDLVLAVTPQLNFLLVDTRDDELARWRDTRARLARVAELAPMDDEALSAAQAAEMQFDLSPPDAVVYGSVRRHLERVRPPRSCFLNRNSADFQTAELVGALGALGCKVLPRFDHGLAYVQGVLGRG